MDSKKTNVLGRTYMDKFCINENYTLYEAIESIDENKSRMVVVTNDEGIVIGVLSQGDIIRALISGHTIYNRVNELLHPNFIYMHEHDIKKAFDIFKKKGITLLPIVDDSFCLKSIITMKDIYRYIENE